MNSSIEPQVLFDREQIQATVSHLAAEITTDYGDKHPIVVGILKGSFIFMADLVRLLDFPLQVEFVQLSSYGSGSRTSGKVKLVKDLVRPIENRHVLLVEDIVDTGLTTSFMIGYLKKKRPASLRLISLVDKPSRRLVPVTIDYLGFTVPNKFIVGYGIDYDERFRNLPAICFVEVEC